MVLHWLPRREAVEFVNMHHRHLKAPAGAIISLGAYVSGELVGVVMLGRPSSRKLHDREVIQVTRLATNGRRNVCSYLLARAKRAAMALGFLRILTYTLESESGASLRGAGWEQTGQTKDEQWARPSRARRDNGLRGRRRRWQAQCEGA